ncbi:hypothetical protein IMF23_15620 [Chelatococcus daeguensis]|uniref:hypothetical protein n=1 Tax=Chelatococcus daeguensis TaxID=444444 RepID=UPI0007AB5E4E|nr:hypothetical protein [Chelatococcus daeguensis]KZE32537.1 hypothetical protein AVW15_01955 [Chelatococcus daeguensis]MBM3084871.1 hypothetical protein [Chelatococcus daeguensis]
MRSIRSTAAIAVAAAAGLLGPAAPVDAASCEASQPCIVVRQAQYGLPGGGGKTCSAYSSVSNLCLGRSSCEIKVNNELCGDPAPGSRKTLFVSWQCDPDNREYFDSAQEYATMTIACEAPR